MKMRRVVAGLAAAALVLVMGPAMASGNSYTVAVGGSEATADHTFTATSTGYFTWWWEKPDGSFLKWPCSSATIPASPASYAHSGSSRTDLLTVNKFFLNSCPGPGGALTAVAAGSWRLHGTSPATPASNDVVKVHIEDISITWSNAICRWTVSGGADGTFDEATQRITFDEQADGTGQSLTVTGVVGCLGQWKNGGKAKLEGALQLTSPDGSVNLR